MQTIDNAFTMKLKRFPFTRLSIQNTVGWKKVNAYIEVGQPALHRYASKINGKPMNAITEIMFNMVTTAHLLGGTPMGKDQTDSVINDKFEVHKYDNMYILDGSVLQYNPGVNPSLTITALSEYAMSLIPAKTGNKKKSIEELMG